MNIFKRKQNDARFFEEEPAEERFKLLAAFVQELNSRADFNKSIRAMEYLFKACQELRGIKTEDDLIDGATKFMLHEEEGK